MCSSHGIDRWSDVDVIEPFLRDEPSRGTLPFANQAGGFLAPALTGAQSCRQYTISFRGAFGAISPSTGLSEHRMDKAAHRVRITNPLREPVANRVPYQIYRRP